MPSDLPKNILKLLAALLKHQAELWLGEEAVGIAGKTLVEIGGETLQQKIDEFLDSDEGSAQLLAAAQRADSYFQRNCDDFTLRQHFTFHFGDLPTVQKALAELPKAMDAGAVLAALRKALEADALELTPAQRETAASLYTEALQRALLQIKDHALPIIGQTVLDIKKQLGEIGLEQAEIKDIVSRIEAKISPTPEPSLPQPLRVLAVIAAPVAGKEDHLPAPAQLSGRAEWAGLRRASNVAPMRLVRLRPPTETALRSLCSPNNAQRFNVVHFICHGLPGALALEDERGLTTLVSAKKIAEAIQDGDVQLVVVNACYSAAGDENSIAQALVDAGIRAVVAHRWPLIDPAAVLFSQSLYRELASGRRLQAAFTHAVEATTTAFTAEKGNAVLAGDETLSFPLPEGLVQPSQVEEGPALPDVAARFFGRSRELLGLADLFASDDLRGAALTGIGGIGKSALAFEAADRNDYRFPGGIAFVRAAEFGFTARDALIELARGLGLDVKDDPEGLLRTYVNTNPCLLTFDNMERAGKELLPLADFVSSLNLDSGSKALFTLRPPLSDRFKDVHEINLRSGLDEANALEYVRFVARNEGAPEQWQRADEALALVRRVSGHPELIRLVVIRSKQIRFGRVKREYMSLSGRLEEALQELIGKQVAEAGEKARKALSFLTIFPQPRILCEAAEAACGEAAEGLDALVEHGVVGLEHGEVQRYVMHPTALDWAINQGSYWVGDDLEIEKLAVVKAYAKWGNAHTSQYDLLQDEHVNMLAALEWAWELKDQPESQKAITDDTLGLREFWGVRGFWTERVKWLERANVILEKSDSEEDKKTFSTNLHNLAVTLTNKGELNEAMRLYQEALKIMEGLGDLKGKSATLHQMANVYVTRGELNEAMRLYQEALKIMEGLGDLKGKSATLHQMANVYVTRGELNEAMRLYQEALKIMEGLGDLQGKSATLHAMAGIYVTRGELNEAMRLYQEALKLLEGLGDLQGKSATLAMMAGIYVTRGELNEAMRLYQEALKLLEGLGDLQGKSATLAMMAGIYVTRGELNEAMRLYQEALKNYEGLGDLKGKSATLHQMAGIYVTRGELNEAMRLYQEALKIMEGLGDLKGKASTLNNMAVVLFQHEKYADALSAFLRALETFEKMEARPSANTVANLLVQFRSMLGPEKFDPLWAEVTGGAEVPEWLSTDSDTDSRTETDEGGTDEGGTEGVGMTLEQFVGMAVQAAREKSAEREGLFEACRKMASNPSAPAEYQLLGKVLQKVLLGDQDPDLSGLPEEIARVVRKALAGL